MGLPNENCTFDISKQHFAGREFVVQNHKKGVTKLISSAFTIFLRQLNKKNLNMTEIQVQFKYNETIRSAIIDEPITYEELEYEIKNEVPKIRDIEFGLMYENHDSDYVVLNKDPRCLRLPITSSSVVPGTDLKRLKLLIFVGHSLSQDPTEKHIIVT
jgi:hypothetical protein